MGERVLDFVVRQPWAIVPEMLETILAVARREVASIEAVQARLGRPLQNARSVSLRDGVALVPVTGPMFRYANLFTEVSGATSVEVLARDFTAALENPEVRGVVLVVDSPGGQASGISELAAMVRAGSARKPVLAYVDGAAQSAAYWLASAAREVVASPTAIVGSIGAVVSVDTRRDDGVVEFVSSQSPFKRPDLSTEDGRAQIQRLVDGLAQVFVEDVARFRGIDAASVLERFGQGGSFVAAEALSRGMVDRVATLETVISELAAKGSASGRSQGVVSLYERVAMDEKLSVAAIVAEYPDIAEALRQEGYAAGLAAGAEAERQRILAIQALAIPGHEALIAEMVADGKTTPEAAALRIVAAEKAANAQRLERMRQSAPAPVEDAASPLSASGDAGLTLEERARRDWERNPALKDEFKFFEAYLGYLIYESKHGRDATKGGR